MRASLAWLGFCGLWACAEAAPPRSAATLPRTRDLLGDTYDPTALEEYRLVPMRADQSSYAGRLPAELRLLGGQRLLDSRGEVTWAETVAAPALVGARQVPAVSGDGFLFWNEEGLFRSRTFLGRLEPVLPLPFEIEHVAFGPGYVLVRGSEGGTRVIDWHTGQLRTPDPLGLVDVVAVDDGRVLTELAFQRFTLSLDRNVTTRDVQLELDGRVRALSHEPLGFVLEDGSLVEVSARGELIPVGVPPHVTDPYELPGGESALEQAVTAGVLRGDERALFPHGSALVEVDLRSGQVRRRSSQLLPGRQACRALEVGLEQLLVCQGQGGVSVFGQVNRDAPLLELTFARNAQVQTGFGRVLVDHDCTGTSVPFSVCLREVGGAWRALSPPQLSQPSAADGAAVRVEGVELLGYGLKEEGGAVAFIRSGEGYAYRDLANGELVRLESSAPFKPSGQTHCRVQRGGEVRCFGPQGPFSFGADGRRRLSPYQFQWVVRAEERALAGDAAGRLFQSLDFGGNWMEIDAPPHFDLRERSTQCSAVGCRIGGWLRLGWRGTSPVRRPLPEAIALPHGPRESLPQLVCSELSPAKVRAGAPLPGAFGVVPAPARHFTVPISPSARGQDAAEGWDLRGVLWGTEPTTNLRFRYVDFLDPAAQRRASELAVASWLALLRAANAPVPALTLEDVMVLQGTPVITQEGRPAGLVLALDDSPFWVKPGRAQPLAFERVAEAGAITSAIASGPNSIALLLDGGVVVRQAPSGALELFRAPGLTRAADSPDALAVSAQGELAVLRFDGSEPPSADQPVLAYRDGKPMEALAPWSSLTLASDARCQGGGGYRAVLAPRRAWLRLERGAASDADAEGSMIASVRWSQQRVCLEAVELGDRELALGQHRLATRVVANFGSKAVAQRLGIGTGAELMQPMGCVLR